VQLDQGAVDLDKMVRRPGDRDDMEGRPRQGESALVGVQAVDVDVDEISPKDAAALSETVTPQGLVAVCACVDVSLETAFARSPALVAVLVEPNDAGNAGAIVRTADAAGADAVVLAGGVDIYNGKAVRASAGSLFHLDVVLGADPLDVIALGRAAGLTSLATAGDASSALDALNAAGVLAGPVLWLFGNEAHGLPAAVTEAADHCVRVPIYGAAESLNLAAAAAVCLYASATERHRVARHNAPERS